MAVWVQHKSGQGEKWEVRSNGVIAPVYLVEGGYQLPKSEYIPCDPPEQWGEVAVTVTPYEIGGVRLCISEKQSHALVGDIVLRARGYRVISIVVERRL